MTGLMKMYKTVFDYLNEIIPEPKCELNYNKDYELLIAVMLSAQTTDKRVNEVTKILFAKYNSLESLSNANVSDIEKIVFSLGNYTKKSKAIIDISKILLDSSCSLDDRNFLESMPMVGRKTASVVLSELYNIPNIAVDTHVERVSKRLGLSKEDFNVLEVEKALKKIIPREKWCKSHLQLVHFGRYYCTAKNPKCNNCKLRNICKYKNRNSTN